MSRRALVAVLAAVLCLSAACATSPTGRRQLMLVSEDWAINASKSAYVQQARQFGQQGRLDDDPALRARVDRITGRLVAQAIDMYPRTGAWEWSVMIIDDPKTVNAWCMAGGRMALYTGLVEQVEPSDDELAQVMGHEIAHALANHTAEKMSTSILSTVGVTAVAVATGSPGAAAGAAGAAMMAVSLPNSRTAEAEADRIGIELAARAGYDPRAAATLWSKMAKVGGGGPPEFLSTHPAPANRQRTLAALAPEMMPLYRAPGARPVHPVRHGAGP